MVTLLEHECGFGPDLEVADIGSGTGLLAKLFLDFGCRVTGVEPNADMRRAGDQFLSAYEKFSSVDGRAERTGLADASVDLVAAGQAFHWFDAVAARREFLRILRPPGWVALVWNEREVPEHGFLRGYEDLLHRYATEYSRVDHRRIDSERIGAFYGHNQWKLATFSNAQEFDLAGARGRLESSSYAPPSGHPGYPAMIAELEQLFQTHQVNGRVPFVYQTKLYYGTL
jgi:SAM-dependent methyltransferase